MVLFLFVGRSHAVLFDDSAKACSSAKRCADRVIDRINEIRGKLPPHIISKRSAHSVEHFASLVPAPPHADFWLASTKLYEQNLHNPLLITTIAMVFKCCVPCCRSGYDEHSSSESGISMHKFPVDLTETWLRAINRRDFVVTQNSRVCSRHFVPSDF